MEHGSEVVWIGLAIVLMVILGVGSSYFLGANNPIEKDFEAEAEQFAEQELHIPPGKLKPEIDAIFECTQKGHKKGFDCIEQPKE